MPRKSIKLDTIQRVRDYLSLAVLKTPEEFPINIKRVSIDLGLSRTTLYKYNLGKEIIDSVTIQRNNSRKLGRLIEKQVYQDIIDEVKRDLAKERAKVSSLQLEIMLIEENIRLLGIDPEELRKELAKPDRRISRAGNVKKFKGRL